MAVITPDTFNALRRYVSVRLQQGVPLVDADWNEQDDIRKFELRAFLKWFVGNGVPDGTNGYRIEGTGLTSDFFIRSGITGAPNGLSNVGRCLVDGLDVMIDADVRFADQPLFVTRAGSAALSTALGVPQIAVMPAPTPKGTVVAYLDVWERLVTPTEDPSLVHAGLGTESCARLKREWVVRVRSGTSVPIQGNADFLAGHSYYALATIIRSAVAVNAADVTDQREQRLLVPPATIIQDAFGTTPAEYRRGRDRPALPLREAINALLRNELPATNDRQVSPGLGDDAITRSLVLDKANGLIAVWSSPRPGSTQVFAARLDLNEPGAGFGPAQQVTTGASHGVAHTAVLQNGELIVAYQGGTGFDVQLKRAPFGQLSAAPEAVVAGTANVFEGAPFVVVSGDIATVFFTQGPAAPPAPQISRIMYRRRRVGDIDFLDAGPQLSPTASGGDFHAVCTAGGIVFAAFRDQIPNATARSVRTVRLNPATNQILGEDTHDVDPQLPLADAEPFLLVTASDEVWLYWTTSNGMASRRFQNGAWQSIEMIPTTASGTGTSTDRQPCAVEDDDGTIWLVWTRGPANNGDIALARRHPVTGLWEQPRLLASSAGNDRDPFVVQTPDRSIWLLWTSTRTGDVDVFFKRIFAAL